MNIPLNIDWQQILLHLLNFVILAGGLYLLLYQPVKAFMEKRQSFYREQDAQAAKLLADAQKELQDLAVTATEKLVLQSGGDAFDQFLNQAERGEPHA